jgi:acetyl-CoA C-acetyltransferase
VICVFNIKINYFQMLKFISKKFSENIVIVNGKRTPIGSFMGKLSNIHGSLLGSAAIQGSLQAAKINPEEVDEVILGNVISAGLGQAPARQAAIKAGLKPTTVCTTINKVCSSGMKSVDFAYQSILTGNSKIVVAGGFESMSLVPHYLYMRKALPFGEASLIDGVMYDGLTDSFKKYLMGHCAEKTNRDLKITRQEQDEYCFSSYERSIEANKKGLFKKEIVEIISEGKKGQKETISEDEEYQRYLKDKIPTLKPVFDKDGSVTAANASKNADGGCAMIVMSEKHAKERGLTPIARIRGFADAEIESVDFSIAPTSVINKLLKKVNLKLNDIDYFEINEAFSSTPLANMKLLGIKHDKMNVHGGAVSLGHPIGASGARIMLSLINVLQSNNGKLGIAAICNGGGGASAVCLEKI